MKPLLQIALDVTSLDQALTILSIDHLVDTVDIIEAGTVLLASEGQKAVKVLHQQYPNKTLVADFKIADAVKTIGSMWFDHGANLITVIAAADLATMENAAKMAADYGQNIQIELYGRWDLELASQWRQVGISHVIYHHARDASKPWDKSDLEKIKALIDLGFHVSVTGGLKPENVSFFKGLDLYSFIIGRSLYEAPDPLVVAQAFQTQLSACFK
jgi:3-dehydro-L-gulonate-6-phosphate decarboxylase